MAWVSHLEPSLSASEARSSAGAMTAASCLAETESRPAAALSWLCLQSIMPPTYLSLGLADWQDTLSGWLVISVWGTWLGIPPDCAHKQLHIRNDLMHKHLLCVEEIVLHEACTRLFYHVAFLLAYIHAKTIICWVLLNIHTSAAGGWIV